MLRCPSPQLVCRVQRNSSGVGLVFECMEQNRAALEDAVGEILQAECHSATIVLKHSKMSCPGEGALVAPRKSQPGSADSLCPPTKAINTLGVCVFILGCL